MYRIMIATSGSYYVQQYIGFRWVKIGGFLRSRAGARQLARDLSRSCAGRVIEYV